MDDERVHMRAVPENWTDALSPIRLVPGDAPWEALGLLLDEVRPECVGLLLPLASQLHRYAYLEARARGIAVSLVPPSNAMVLTGLMEEVPIEAIVADEDGARRLVEDLHHIGMLPRIKAWLIVSPVGKESSFTPPSGVVFRDSFV